MSLDFNSGKPQGYYASRSVVDPEYVSTLKQRMAPQARGILQHLWPNGRIERDEFVVGSIQGERGKSLKISLAPGKIGVGADFSDGQTCGDLIDCWALATRGQREARGAQFNAICEEIEQYLEQRLAQPFKLTSPAPPPEPKPAPREELGPPTAEYHYTDAEGARLVVVYRYDFINDQGEPDKTFRPWNVLTRKKEAPESNRPLYNQAGIKDSSHVVFVEGEKAAQALIDIGIPATCAMGGSKAPVGKTDWSPLTDKHVLIWPDADKPGLELANNVAAVLNGLAKTVRVLDPWPGKEGGWDAADAIAEGCDVRSHLNQPATQEAPQKASGGILDWHVANYTAGEPPPREWLVDGVIPLGVAVILAAMGDAGKGMLTIDLALKVACCADTEHGILDDGIPALSGTIAAHGAVVIFTAEDDMKEVHRRVDALDPEGLRFGPDVKLYIKPLPNAGGPKPLVISGRGGPEATPHYEEIHQQLLAIPGLKLVVFDPLASFVLGDLNKDQAICSFATGLLASLATETGATVLACHHMTKGTSRTPILTPEQARDAIRGQAAIVDGVRCAYTLWPAEPAEGKRICDKLGVPWKRNGVFKGAVAKTNAESDREVHYFVRNPRTGLLHDRTGDYMRTKTFSADLMKLLIEAVAVAAEDGHPFTKTGAAGLYAQRSRLPSELRELGDHPLRHLAQDALDNEFLVQAASGGKQAQWLDVPHGPFAKGIGTFAEGAAPQAGRPKKAR